MALDNPTSRIGGLVVGQKNPEPGPFFTGVGGFALQAERQGDPGQVVLAILIGLNFGQVKLFL